MESRNEAQITTNSQKRDWIYAPSRVFWNDRQIRIVWKMRSIKSSFPVSDCSGRWHLQQIFRAGSESPDGNVRMYQVRLISRSHVTQYFVSEEEYFEIYPVLNRQPMKFKQNRGIWSRFLESVTRRAEEFWMRCNLLRSLSGRLMSKLVQLSRRVWMRGQVFHMNVYRHIFGCCWSFWERMKQSEWCCWLEVSMSGESQGWPQVREHSQWCQQLLHQQWC